MPVSTEPQRTEWLLSADAAAFLQVSERTLKRWRADGLVPFVRLPGGRVRYSRQELTVWLEKRSRGAR